MTNCCEQCGITFHKRRRMRFCSRGCWDTYRNAHKPDPDALPVSPLSPMPAPPAPPTQAELARLEVFKLTGLVEDVQAAHEAVQATPWPDDKDAA